MLEAYWYIAGQSKQLRRKPKAVVLFDQAVVLFRDDRGKAWALQDRCAHRNAPLSRGRVRGPCLECPYHGWQWAGDGSLKALPATDRPPKLSIPSYPCMEQDGYIWICLGPNPAQTEPRRFPFLGHSGWHSFRMQTRFQGSVEACLENFLDCPHALFVHRRWFRSPTARPVRTIVSTLDDGAQVEYFKEPRERSLVWWSLSPAKEAMTHTDRFIAPNTSRVDYRFNAKAHYVITSSCTPVSAKITDVYTVISFRFGWLTPFIRLFFQPMARTIIRQDVSIIGATQRNIEGFGGPAFQVTETDLLFQAIHRWRTALDHGKTPPACGSEHEISIRL